MNIIYATFAVFVLAYFAFSSRAQAVLPSPTPDGFYPGGNTAEGKDALFNLETGAQFNTAIGFQALFRNTTGFWNTANGAGALHENIGGAFNTAAGVNALFSNTSGQQNSVCGAGALQTNTDGSFNVANGGAALLNNTIGSSN